MVSRKLLKPKRNTPDLRGSDPGVGGTERDCWADKLFGLPLCELD
jgi:hypothetical protein